MKKSNFILTVIISITAISICTAFLFFENRNNNNLSTESVSENSHCDSPGFEEVEELDESMKSNSTYKNKAMGAYLTSYEFEKITASQTEGFMLGDVDRNGEISIADATQIQKSLAYLIELTPEESVLANVNADDSVNILDATLIQMYCSGLIDSFTDSEPTTNPTTPSEEATLSTEPTKPSEEATLNTEASTSDEDTNLPPKAPNQDGEWGVSVKN